MSCKRSPQRAAHVLKTFFKHLDARRSGLRYVFASCNTSALCFGEHPGLLLSRGYRAEATKQKLGTCLAWVLYISKLDQMIEKMIATQMTMIL